MKTFIIHKENDALLADWPSIYKEAGKHRRGKITVKSYGEDAEWTDQQRKYWKGVLLPALAADSGDTLDYWETKLKLAVLPDEFAPVTTVVNRRKYTYIPSVSTLSIKKMNILIEGSVAKCHDWGFDWVTLPDKELRK